MAGVAQGLQQATAWLWAAGLQMIQETLQRAVGAEKGQRPGLWGKLHKDRSFSDLTYGSYREQLSLGHKQCAEAGRALLRQLQQYKPAENRVRFLASRFSQVLAWSWALNTMLCKAMYVIFLGPDILLHSSSWS